jgi:hypothetical protein
MSDDPTTSLIPFTGDGSRLIRKQWHDGRWFLSVIDVVGLLTDSADPGSYWAQVKRRVQDEGFAELVTKCHRLKMRSIDGKMRETHAADVETLLRIIQSIPSPKAEPVKQWLAGVGAERINEAADLEGLTEDQRCIYARHQIEHGNKSLSAAVGDSGVITPRDFAVFHDAGYQGLYDGERMRDIHVRKGLTKGQHILDHMDSEELAANLFRVMQTQAKLRRDPPRARPRPIGPTSPWAGRCASSSSTSWAARHPSSCPRRRRASSKCASGSANASSGASRRASLGLSMRAASQRRIDSAARGGRHGSAPDRIRATRPVGERHHSQRVHHPRWADVPGAARLLRSGRHHAQQSEERHQVQQE